MPSCVSMDEPIGDEKAAAVHGERLIGSELDVPGLGPVGEAVRCDDP